LRAIDSGESRPIGSPNRRISPPRGRCQPMMVLMQVVLPAPLRPSNARIFPGFSEKDTA
jgi:hypothetical protein